MQVYEPRKFRFLFAAGMAFFAIFGVESRAFAASDLDVITSRLFETYLADAPGGGEKLIASQNADGSWTDVNYDDHGNNWAPAVHLNRLQAMAGAYQRPNSTLYHSPKLLDGITRGLTFWIAKKPTADNWWFNEIGQQLTLESILVLTHDALPAATLRASAALFIAPSETKKPPTGQNLIWYAEEQLVRGLLLQSPQDVATSVEKLQQAFTMRKTLGRPFSEKVVQWPTGDGIQTDYSFHQHGSQLYSGGYGLGALQAGIDYAKIFRGTRYAFSPDTLAILTKYLLIGTRSMVRGKLFELGAAGREISRPGISVKTPAVARAADALAELQPDQATELRELAKHVRGEGKPYSYLGHRHFWNSDFSSHQRASYYTSVKMVSSRTNGSESLNGENLKGFWLPFGMTSIARDGSEYAGLPPIWDWTHLPGVTSLERIPALSGGDTQPDPFVGGVSDEVYGASAMRFELPATSGANLRAQKAWFYFDQEFVALGAGITSSDAAAVNTTLNQTQLRSDVLVDGSKVGAGTRAVAKASWVFHDGVGYVFPKGANVTVKSGPQTGTWSSINQLKSATPLTGNVFSLWMSHGSHPKDAQYAYVVVPGTDEKTVASYAAKVPLAILENSTKIQAVRHGGLGITQAIFYDAGSLELGDGMKLTVDRPCLVQLKDEGEMAYTLTVSSPVAPQVKVTLETGFGSPSLLFNLPVEARIGESVSQKVSVSLPTGFFKIASKKRVYQSNGKSDVCFYTSRAQFEMNGGSKSSRVAVLPKAPPSSRFTAAQSCVLAPGFFRIGDTKTVYQSFAGQRFCSFLSPEGFRKAGGATDYSNVHKLNEIPPAMKSIGRCESASP